MFRMTTSACIEAPADVVWAHLARLEPVHVWTDVIHRSYMSSACTSGVRAERTGELRGSRSLHERVVAWDEGRSFTYESTDAPMMKLARNRWSVTPAGARSLVTSAAEMEFRGGWLGRLAGWFLIPVMRLVLPNPLAKFKFWVETGRPYVGRASSLPLPAPAC
ncbi:MAG: SRPBCC family protein [Chloroflexota bacterium]